MQQLERCPVVWRPIGEPRRVFAGRRRMSRIRLHALIDFDGDASSVGICWADSAETDWLCDGCNIGDGCLQRKASQWVCVPIDVCETLWNLGVRNVCRYADKTRYDDRAIPLGAGCPPPASTPNYTYYACGGDCAYACGPSQRCNGVVPDHPFGLCNGGPGLGGAYNSSFSCGTSPPCDGFSPDYLCAVPNVPDVDIDVARRYGVCMPKAHCFDFAADFPGGLGCYDAAGNRLK